MIELIDILLILGLFTMVNMQTLVGSCSGTSGLNNCGYAGWTACYEYNDGSFFSCDNIGTGSTYAQYLYGYNVYIVPRTCNCYNHAGNCCGYATAYNINMTIYRKCSV